MLFEPGESVSYTTYGYTLLGAVMEAAAGLAFEDILREEIFEPAGMSRSTIDHRYRLIDGRSGLYEYGMAVGGQFGPDGGFTNATPTDNSIRVPGGGLLSTAEDLVRFGLAVAGGELLGEEELAEMFSLGEMNDGTQFYYGQGWMLKDDDDGRRICWHSGAQPGANSYLGVWPDQGVVVAMLTNVENGPISNEEGEILVEPFLDAVANGVSMEPAVNPNGRYELIGKDNGDGENVIRASVDVWGDAEQGWQASLSSNGMIVPFSSVDVAGDRMRLVGLMRGRGLRAIELKIDGRVVSGELVGGGGAPLRGTKSIIPSGK